MQDTGQRRLKVFFDLDSSLLTQVLTQHMQHFADVVATHEAADVMLCRQQKEHETPVRRYLLPETGRLQDTLQVLYNMVVMPDYMMTLQQFTLDTRQRLFSNTVAGSSLTDKETAFMAYLIRQYPDICSREDILADVWGYQPDIDSHTLETHVYRLRQKLEELFGNTCKIIAENDGYRLQV